MPGFAPAPTPVIIMVPLNFEPAVLGLSGVLHATHWVAVSVFGLPQLGQKIVTGALRITASVDRSPGAATYPVCARPDTTRSRAPRKV